MVSARSPFEYPCHVSRSCKRWSRVYQMVALDSAVYADRRKALAAHLSDLFKVPLQQLPFYARIAATLSQEYPARASADSVRTPADS